MLAEMGRRADDALTRGTDVAHETVDATLLHLRRIVGAVSGAVIRVKREAQDWCGTTRISPLICVAAAVAVTTGPMSIWLIFVRSSTAAEPEFSATFSETIPGRECVNGLVVTQQCMGAALLGRKSKKAENRSLTYSG
jgi:hypothetical protein